LSEARLNDGLTDVLRDALCGAGIVTGRRMFGGVGVYCDGIFFAIISGGVIYVRTSEAMRPDFEAEGSAPFTYATKKGMATLESYWRLPERLLDDPDELRDWAGRAIAAARSLAAESERKRQAAATLSGAAALKSQRNSKKR